MPNYIERQNALLSACGDLNLDALLICATGNCFGLNGTAQGHMTFLSGWDSYDSPSILVLRRGRKPWLLVSHYRMKMMALDNLSDIDVDWIDQTELGVRLGTELQAGGGSIKRVGLCGWEDMLAQPWQTVTDTLAGVEFAGIVDRVAALRAVKDAEQISAHRKVAAVCDEMFDKLAGSKVLGRYAYQIKADLEHHAKTRGCEFVQHWMTIGKSPDYPRYFKHENRQIPQAGDTILYGMMMTMDGIWGHAVRCYYVGEPDARRRSLQQSLVGFQREFVNQLRPGRDLADVVRKGLESTAGLIEEIGDPKTHMLRLGHGIGCSYAEPGLTEPFPRSYYKPEEERERARSVMLRSGMLFEIHPMFLFEGGAVGTGDMVLVDEVGPQFLTQYPRDLCALAA